MGGESKTESPFDEWLNTDLFANNTSTSMAIGNAPIAIEDGADDSANGVDYSDLFASSSSADFTKPSTEPELPFAPESEEAFPPTLASDSFSPSVFEPATFPGSPIGALSPASDDSSARPAGSMSPISFDFDLTSQPTDSAWTLEPSMLTAAASVAPEDQKPEIIIETPSVERAPEPSASTSAAGSKRGRQVRSVSTATGAGDDGSEMEADSDFGGSRSRATARRQSKRQAKQPKTSVSQFATAELHHTNAGAHLAPVPDWMDKPDPETYSKMTPAEKRQMRNKISARNFRHRKKEQLSHLEQEIADRDEIIGQLRNELGTIKHENEDLKVEMKELKEKFEEMMEKMTNLSTSNLGPRSAAAGDDWPLASPASEEPPVASTSSAPSFALKPKSPNTLALPNLRKDVAPTLKRSSGSWMTQPMGGFTSVHTTLLPEVNPYSAHAFNAALDKYSQGQGNDCVMSTPASSLVRKPFSDSRPFEPALSEKAQQQLRMRPDVDSSALTPAQVTLATQDALIAGLAQQALFSRMATALIDAFASTSEDRRLGRMNPDKVAAVLSGKATLRVHHLQ